MWAISFHWHLGVRGALILGNVLKSFSGTAFFLGSGQTVIKQLPHTIWHLLHIRQLLLTWIGRKEARPYSDMIFRGQIWVKNQLKFDLLRSVMGLKISYLFFWYSVKSSKMFLPCQVLRFNISENGRSITLFFWKTLGW